MIEPCCVAMTLVAEIPAVARLEEEAELGLGGPHQPLREGVGGTADGSAGIHDRPSPTLF